MWLLIEWPKDEKAPTKYYLSSLPADTALKKLVRLAKLRWRVERDYQELKSEVGRNHFEGRTGGASTTTPPSAWWPMESSLSARRFFARSPSSASAPAAAPHRPLRPLSAPRRRTNSTSRIVADLIR
ncbi:hypothetical protein [Cystobacter fuscus]|uniref:hypothetical protein n=1 Tax=Cystobacter fuscus TaxID=43 RepID=UPI0037C07779